MLVKDMFRRFIAKKAAVKTETVAKSIAVGSLKKQPQKTFPASIYDPKAWNNQTMVINFTNKKTAIVSTNLTKDQKETTIQEYPLDLQRHVSQEVVHNILESYRTSNNLKCARFGIKVIKGKDVVDYATQKAFLEGFNFASLD